MSTRRITCAWCGKRSDKSVGAVNRAHGIGAPLYCDRTCAGLGRRGPPRTDAEKREAKRVYDMEYRDKNRAMLKAKKHAYFAATYDPEVARVARKIRMPYHVEYLRRRMQDPAYREGKRVYDQNRRAKLTYGPAAECFVTLLAIEKEIRSRSDGYQNRQANRTGNKRQNRTRADAWAIRSGA